MNTFKDKNIRCPEKSAIKFTSTLLVQNQVQRKSWMIWSADFSLWTSHKTPLTDNADKVFFIQNMEVSIEGKPKHSVSVQTVNAPSKIFWHFHSFFCPGEWLSLWWHFLWNSGFAALIDTWLVWAASCSPLNACGDLSVLTEVHGTSSDLARLLESRI